MTSAQKVTNDGISTANNNEEGSDQAHCEDHPGTFHSVFAGIFKLRENYDEDLGIVPYCVLAQLASADVIRRRSGDPDTGGPEPTGRILQALLQA